MSNCSSAYAEIVNICNAAKWHKERCNDSQCNVALYLLGLTAKRLLNHSWFGERDELRRIIAETDWS